MSRINERLSYVLFIILIVAIGFTIKQLIDEAPSSDPVTIAEVIEQKHVPSETFTVTKVEPHTVQLFVQRRPDFDGNMLDGINEHIQIDYTLSNGEEHSTDRFTLDNYRYRQVPDVGSIIYREEHYVTTAKMKDGKTITFTSRHKVEPNEYLENPIGLYEPETRWTFIEPYRKPLDVEITIVSDKSASETRNVEFTN